jgi:hypothetical protein
MMLLTPDVWQRIQEQRQSRQAHLALLAAFTSPVSAPQTPPRPANIVELFPEVKVLLRATHRLHPRPGPEPAANTTKLGGRVLWSSRQDWPVCEETSIPYQPILQVLAEDTPSQLRFPSRKDVLQLLWVPRDFPAHNNGPKPLVLWHQRADLDTTYDPSGSEEYAYLDYVPVPSALAPEKVLELPDWHTVQVTPLKEKIEQWQPDGELNPIKLYDLQCSVAPGTKLGGYPRWLAQPAPPTCSVCKRGMDYQLTIDSKEWRDPSWRSVHEADKDHMERELSTAAGLTLPVPGNRHLYVCHRCPDWPYQLVG